MYIVYTLFDKGQPSTSFLKTGAIIIFRFKFFKLAPFCEEENSYRIKNIIVVQYFHMINAVKRLARKANSIRDKRDNFIIKPKTFLY